MSTKDSLNELVRLYVEKKMGFPVLKAELGTITSTYDYGGCETCGPDITKDFDLRYWIVTDSRAHYLTVDGDPLSWLAYDLLPMEKDLTDSE